MKFFRRDQSSEKPKLEVLHTYVEDGIHIEILLHHLGRTQPVLLAASQPDLPLSELSPRELAELSILDALWIAGRMEEREQGYFCPYKALHDLEPEVRAVLRLPQIADVTVSLQSRSAVGTRSFRIEALVTHPQHGPLPIHRRIGPVVPIGSEHVLLPEEVAKLLDAVEERPAEPQDQLRYVAQVKTLARAAGADLDPYLMREEYVFAEKIGLAPAVAPDGSIEIVPVLEDLPDLYRDVEQEALDKGHAFITGTGGGRVRIFPSERARERARRIREAGSQLAKITGQDVPEFVNNPKAFVPTEWDEWEIDLDLFSKRVKGLGIRTYTSKPYVTAKPTGGGWFDVDVGITVAPTDVDDLADEDSARADEELERKLVEAQRRGERWVEHNGAWYQVPTGTVDIETVREQLDAATQGKPIPLERLRYVLEIFDNVQELEYDETLLHFLTSHAPQHERSQPPPSPPFALSLHPHQVEGYQWLLSRRAYHIGGLLADEMGLGKTIQVLALAARLHADGELTPSLIVVPKTLIDNWEDEIRRACPPLRVYLHTGPHRLRDVEAISAFDFVLTTYDTLIRDQVFLGQVDWNLVVLDEAQKIRNYTTSRASAAKAVKARIRLALTGTPVENKLGDLWSIVDFIRPGLLPSYKEFRERYEKPLETGSADVESVERRLLANIAPVYLRRTKEGNISLPPKEVLRCPVSLSDEQRRRYLEAIRVYRQSGSRRGEALKTIQHLVKICSHPYLVDEEKAYSRPPEELVDTCPKLRKTLEILDDVRRRGEKAVVFTHFLAMQTILRKVILHRFGIWPDVINGDAPHRVATVKRFNASPEFNILIVSPLAAGVGLNITGANHVIHYTRWWNPAVENQATDRVHRIGQEKPVRVYIPIVTEGAFRSGTAEERIDAILQKKEALARSIIIPSSQLEVTNEELYEVLEV